MRKHYFAGGYYILTNQAAVWNADERITGIYLTTSHFTTIPLISRVILTSFIRLSAAFNHEARLVIGNWLNPRRLTESDVFDPAKTRPADRSETCACEDVLALIFPQSPLFGSPVRGCALSTSRRLCIYDFASNTKKRNSSHLPPFAACRQICKRRGGHHHAVSRLVSDEHTNVVKRTGHVNDM